MTEQKTRRTESVATFHEPQSWSWCPVNVKRNEPGRRDWQAVLTSSPAAWRPRTPSARGGGGRSEPSGAVDAGARLAAPRLVDPRGLRCPGCGSSRGAGLCAQWEGARAESDAVCGQRFGFGLGGQPVSGPVHSATPSRPRDTLPGQEFTFHVRKPQAQHPADSQDPPAECSAPGRPSQ